MLIVRGKDRNFVDKGWLKGYRNFSFQDYYDEYNDNFGSLIVLNDEEFAAGSGFKLHPTADVEVITYVERGELEVFNDLLNEPILLESGQLQLLSSGEGVLHSEVNKLPDRGTSFIQFWFTPSTFGGEPAYVRLSPKEEELTNQLYLLFSKEKDAPAVIGQDVNFYLSRLEGGNHLLFQPEKGRGTLIFVLAGRLKIGQEILEDRDSMRTMKADKLDIRAERDSKFFLVDIK